MADPRYRSQNPAQFNPFYHNESESDSEDDAKAEYDLDEIDENEADRYSYRRRITPQSHEPEITQDEENHDDGELERHQKKRKFKNLMDYELTPRPGTALRNNSSSSTEWTERETFALLEAWGNKYLQLGRKSLRSEDWSEVAEKVSEFSNSEKLDTQCRNRLDTLKKKYKKEKVVSGNNSKWVYFKKLDMLMSVSNKQQQCGLACGVDSGEFVFINPKVYLNCANGFDEMRDSPGNSESGEGNDDSDGDEDDGGSSYSLLADSIEKFGAVYEKIEKNKRQQMMELEKMRMDFHRELELQKEQIMQRAQVEIEKIQDGVVDVDATDSDTSAENLSV